jgi:hypothetical protein
MADVDGEVLDGAVDEFGWAGTGAVLGDVATTGGESASFQYSKRWKDSGAPPANDPTYVYEQTAVATASYSGVPPYGGPLVDESVIAVDLVE